MYYNSGILLGFWSGFIRPELRLGFTGPGHVLHKNIGPYEGPSPGYIFGPRFFAHL